MFKGDPEVVEARKVLVREMLRLLRERDPQKFAGEKAAFPKSFEQWGAKGWEETLAFINPLLADAPAPPTAEFRMQAKQCAHEYARISRVIGGVK
jgi:hypothetical protein